VLFYTHIAQTLVSLLHGLLNYEKGGLDGHIILQHVFIVYTCSAYFVMYWSM